MLNMLWQDKRINMIFGITGQTGSGKSTVSDIFRRLGVYVADADKASRSVCTPGSGCLKEIEAEFGSAFIGENGELDRRALGKVVFADEKKLEKLSEITHKYIYRAVKRELEETNKDICAVDGAVLIGSGLEELCELMVAVTADEKMRKRRIIERDGLSESEAERRIAAQKSEEFYREHSDFVIENNGGAEELEKQVKLIYERIAGKVQ